MKGSIKEYVGLKGSMAKETILSGSIKSFIILKGSVDRFVRNLIASAKLLPIVNITAKAYSDKVSKNISIIDRIQVLVKAVSFKISKNTDILNEVNISARADSIKIAKPKMKFDVLFGTSSFISDVEDYFIEDVKDWTLRKFTTTVGVLARIVRQSNANIVQKIQINASAIVVRKKSISEVEDLYIEDVKDLTLSEFSEIII